MDYQDFVASKVKDGQAIIDGLTPKTAHLFHMGSALLGEAVEFQQAIVNNDHENAIEELGDIEFYLCAIATEYDIDPNDVVKREGERFAVTITTILNSCETIFDITKKLAIYGKELTPDMRTKLKVAAMTVYSSLQAAYQYLNVTETQVLAHNIKKLSGRYPEGYTDAAAQARADKA